MLFSNSRMDNNYYVMLVTNLVGDCHLELSLLNVDGFSNVNKTRII